MELSLLFATLRMTAAVKICDGPKPTKAAQPRPSVASVRVLARGITYGWQQAAGFKAGCLLV